MFESFDMSLVDWARAQFALTALYHWIFVPLTLGITFIIAIMEWIYVKTWDEKWAKTVKFWMLLFAINFAIWVATWIILEFEFGTNWSNYSWFVWDIFWAPLAIEWLMAFFLESVMIAVMFWWWWKISKKAHLRVTWLTAIWTNLSAIWILAANSWMQYPVWMSFNPDTMRNEMVNFWDVIFSPIAMNKFLHVISSSYVFASAFVIAVSCWYLLKWRETEFARKSIKVASIFWFLSSIVLWITGDIHAKEISNHQPMKLAAMEALYDWKEGVWLKTIAIFWQEEKNNIPKINMSFEIPNTLSFLAFSNFNAFVPWINDILYKWYKDNNWVWQKPYIERISSWKEIIKAFNDYIIAKRSWNYDLADSLKPKFLVDEIHPNWNKTTKLHPDFGFGYFDESKMWELVPNIPLLFYSFRIMVWAWTLLPFIFLIFVLVSLRISIFWKYENSKTLFRIGILSFILAFLAQQLWWVLAEVGRQPWTVQNILPTKMSTSHLEVRSVQFTFFLFVIIFTILLIAEIKIMSRAIYNWPKISEK